MPPAERANWHDAFDAQMALWRWYRTEIGRDWMSHSWAENTKDIPDPSTIQMSKDLYIGELSRLIDCDPIFVSADMCDLISYARESFQPEPLLESDIITPRGFMLYETPFQVPDRFDNPTDIKAVSWTRIVQTGVGDGDPGRTAEIAEKLREQGVEVEEHSRGLRIVGTPDESTSGVVALEEMIIQAGGEARGIAVTLYTTYDPEKLHPSLRGQQFPPVLPMHLTPWYFDMTFDGNEVDVSGIPTGAIWWWTILQTTLRMMQQKVSVKHHLQPDRAARREMKVHGYPPETTTVVVRLRGEEGERKEPSGEKANYSHRFIRRGHWRNQPYKSEGIYRQIWIDPTIVGDKDLPLIVKPRRAFQWSR